MWTGASAVRCTRLNPAWPSTARKRCLASLGAEHRAVAWAMPLAAHTSVEQPADRGEVVLDAVASKRLDQHDRPISSKGCPSACQGADGVAHVVQRVEEAHES
jgi:hypothetical protein